MTTPHALIQLLRMEHTRTAVTGPGDLLEDVDGVPLAVAAPDALADYIGPIVLTGPEWQTIARHLLAELDDATPAPPTGVLPSQAQAPEADAAWLLELLRAEGRPVTHRIDPEPIAGENGEPIGATFARTESAPLSVSYTAEEWEIVARHLIAQTEKENAR